MVIDRKHLLLIFLILATALSIRALTFMFMRAHLKDPGWFQSGSYAVFDRQAHAILEGRQGLFWISDPARTDLAQYPPAFPVCVALIYKLTGNYSAYSVQGIQAVIDLLFSLLIISGLSLTAFGWRTALATGFLVSVSPLLALYASYPSADAPGAWFVLSGNWVLLLAAKRKSVWLALASGLLLGIACWLRVNPLYLCVGWAVVLFLFVKTSWQRRFWMSAATVLGTVLIVSPIVVRNFLVFPDFTPTGGTIGTNLWEGLGETELGRDNGFAFGDDKMIEHERIQMGLPAGQRIEAQWPDGIRRDQVRLRESLDFIKQHPFWYASVMAHRMWGMLKVAGKPSGYYGTSGINVTPRKCLPAEWQHGVTALGVTVLGMLQSVMRYLVLPLALVGVYFAIRKDWLTSSVLLVTVVYYLGPGTVGHTEIRYVIPMQGVLIVFAGEALRRLVDLIGTR